jgi:hypothetical protein
VASNTTSPIQQFVPYYPPLQPYYPPVAPIVQQPVQVQPQQPINVTVQLPPNAFPQQPPASVAPSSAGTSQQTVATTMPVGPATFRPPNTGDGGLLGLTPNPSPAELEREAQP